jgi:hypothetical protein
LPDQINIQDTHLAKLNIGELDIISKKPSRKRNDQLPEREIDTYEGRHDDLIFQAPAFYRQLIKMLDDPMLPRRLSPLGIVAVAHFALPYDISPRRSTAPMDTWTTSF